MSQFLRLLTEIDKYQALTDLCTRLRKGETDSRYFEVDSKCFDAVPGKPFAYWVSEAVRETFTRFESFEVLGERKATKGTATTDDLRFVRLWWEVGTGAGDKLWTPFSKGGAFSPFYFDVYLVLSWGREGAELKASIDKKIGEPGQWSRWINAIPYYFRPGLTWPRRTQGGLSLRALPAGCIFADKGPAAFVADDDPEELLALLSLVSSRAFAQLVSLQMAFGSYEVGVIQKTPIPSLNAEQQQQLAILARRAWSLKRTLDTIVETSHAFLLPIAIRSRQGDFDPLAIEAELSHIQVEIDEIAFELYGFSDVDRMAALGNGVEDGCDGVEAAEEEDEDEDVEVPSTDALLSWGVGVAMGRFDWRLAIGERQAPSEIEPFDSLPAKSTGMLPDGLTPFNKNLGILVDDQGHSHDLARVVENVLDKINVHISVDIRRWLQKDFFAFHLKRYSKTRRKAPIYWPLTTTSGGYTLWLYYPSLNDQTLFTAVNDFVDPKLEETRKDLESLRGKGNNRSKQEEKDLETLTSLEHELADIRYSLLEVAPNYRPSHDDGVQISAAPLWRLFSHRPWQKVLKDTWAKLEKGDYDWSHLAMNYWPDRVRDKCITDKSLAIAHNLEHLYIEPEPKPAKARGIAKKQDA